MSSISEKTLKYMDLLSKDFDEIDFYNFIDDLLNLTSENVLNGVWQEATSEQYKHYIEKAKLYAKYDTSNRREVGVILIKLKDNKNPANARTLQRNYIAHLLESYSLDACLAAIYSNKDHSWRLSFVKREISVEVGKLKTKVSPAKRYSYLFGKDELNHTAKVQLLDLLENNEKKYTIEEIEEKFSVEKVTKEFFDNYKENYLKLYENLENNNEFQEESKKYGFTTEEFAKKLMGQIVFLYFLQKKGWLGVSLVPKELTIEEYNKFYNKEDTIGKKILEKYYINFSGGKRLKPALLRAYKENEQEIDKLSDIFVDSEYDGKWGSGEKNFIRKLFDRYKNLTPPDIHNKFFDTYLEPFFYNGLNHKRKNQYFSIFNCKIPFLNGGLFEPIDNYLWEISEFDIEDDIFSNKDQTGILDFFDRFNFTMNEEEPLEKDVAVDPEMLGKIFENLLEVKDRKSKGAFYTPRDIVHYMCQESLSNFLVNKVGVDYNEIKEFIQYGEIIRDTDLKDATIEKHLVGDSIFKNIIQIDKALENIKIADPAVGSGAFPLGLLNEIVKIRDIITSYLLIYNRLELFDKKYDESFIINNKRSIYNIKWNTIKNCIYAVDIENSAVDITKLRLWLSIVVDQVEVPKSGPEPLPNLDCKIMQGNSLIDEFNGIKLIDEKFIDEFKEGSKVSFNEGGTYKTKGKNISISSDQIAIGDGQKKAQIDGLIELKKELYGTNDSGRKKELLERIQSSRRELLRLNFAGTSNEKELFEIDCTHNKPYFAWMLEFIEVFIENNGFDIVIGNPPYVSVKGISIEEKNLYRNLFKVGQGRFNLFTLMIEKGIDLLKDEGCLSYIQPDGLYTNIEYTVCRELILNNTTLKQIITFDERVFENAAVDTAITILIKRHSENNKITIIKNMKTTVINLMQSEILNNDDYLIPIKLNPEDSSIINKIKNASKYGIGDFLEIQQGIIYSGTPKEEIFSNTKLNEKWKKSLDGRDVSKWYINWDLKEENRFIEYTNKLHRPREERLFLAKEKILLPRKSTKIYCGYDNEQYYALNTAYVCLLRDDRPISEVKLKYVLALLNSKLINYYYKTLYLGWQIVIPALKAIPILYDEDIQKLIVEKVDIILNSKGSDISNEEKYLDSLIYKLYNISENEISIIERRS